MTTYNLRPAITSSYNLTRIGGAYLVTSIWEYITTSIGERIIVRVRWGTLPLDNYNTRDIISSSYTTRPSI